MLNKADLEKEYFGSILFYEKGDNKIIKIINKIECINKIFGIKKDNKIEVAKDNNNNINDYDIY